MSKTGFREILCVFLLFVLLAFAGIAESFNAQIVLRDAEGTEYGTIDLIPVTTSGGETGYWFNLFGMDEQKVQALQSGNSVIRAYRPDTGEQLPDVPIAADAGIATLFEGETVHRSDVADPTNEALRFPILSSYQDAPADQTALDGVMQQLGFTVQEYTEPVNPPQEPEEVPPEITVPQFMAPGYDGVEIRQSPNGEVAGTVNASDVLTGYGYELDAQGGVWFNVQSYATDVQGYVNSEAVSPLDEAGATGRMQAIQDALAQAVSRRNRTMNSRRNRPIHSRRPLRCLHIWHPAMMVLSSGKARTERRPERSMHQMCLPDMAMSWMRRAVSGLMYSRMQRVLRAM